MTSVVTIKKQIVGIKQILAMRGPPDISITFAYGSSDDPHGKYGFRRLNLKDLTFEPLLVNEELAILQEDYAGLPKEIKHES